MQKWQPWSTSQQSNCNLNWYISMRTRVIAPCRMHVPTCTPENERPTAHPTTGPLRSLTCLSRQAGASPPCGSGRGSKTATAGEPSAASPTCTPCRSTDASANSVVLLGR